MKPTCCFRASESTFIWVVDEQVGEERETNQDGKEEEGFERVGLSENEAPDHYEQDQQQLDPDERSPENSIPGKIAIQF